MLREIILIIGDVGMVFFFNCIVLFLFLLSRYLYRTILNPISIFVSIWFISVNLHQSGLIYYYPLTLTTWAVLIFTHVVYASGNLVGRELGLKANKQLQRQDCSE